MAETNNTDLMIALSKKEDKNPVVVHNPKKSDISNFSIELLPKSDIPLRELNGAYVSTLDYEIQGQNSNIFRISLSQLNYQYFAHRRLIGGYIKVISPKKLKWDGQEYIKSK